MVLGMERRKIPSIARVLEHPAMAVVLVVELVEELWWELAPPGSAYWDVGEIGDSPGCRKFFAKFAVLAGIVGRPCDRVRR